MSDCCSGTSCETSSEAVCRECGQKAQTVQRLTLEHLLKADRVADLRTGDYFFCATPACSVVYFSNETGQYFGKQDVRVRVGIKETEEPVPVCYCFAYTRKKIFEEVQAAGESTALPFITERVKAGLCRCEIENPSGRCCLGEVKKTVTEAKKLVC
ncbi:MAG: hypothetical protein ACE5IY_23300 [bacterium]